MNAPVDFNNKDIRTIYTDNEVINKRQLFVVRSTISVFLGLTAGILGLTNIAGVAFFIILLPLLQSISMMLKMKSLDFNNYFRDGLIEVTLPNSDSLFGYVLSWTLSYGLIHGKFWYKEIYTKNYKMYLLIMFNPIILVYE